MSNSLVRKSLNLLTFEIDIIKEKDKIKKKKYNKGSLDLIPANYRIIKSKRLNKVKNNLKSKIDPVEENIKKLLALSGEKNSSVIPLKVSKEKKEDLPAKEQSIFTEEDFKNFENEYSKE